MRELFLVYKVFAMKPQSSKGRSLSKMVIAIIAFTSLLSISISCFILDRVIERHDEELIKLIASYVYDDINSELLKPLIVAQTMTNDHFLKENLKAEPDTPFEEQVEIMSVYLNEIKEGFGYSCVAVTSSATMNYYTYKGFHKRVSPLYDEYDIWYKNFVDSGEAYHFDVNLDETNNDIWTIFADARIEDENGKLLGVCATGVLMEKLQTAFAQDESTYGIKINLVDEKGLIKVDTNSRRIENALIEGVIGAAQDDQLTLMRFDDTYIVMKYIPEFDWYLVVQRDGNKESGAFSNLILYMLSGFFVTMVVILKLVQWSVSKRQRQIEELAKKTGITSHAGLYASMHLIDLVDDTIHELSRDPKVELLNIPDGGDAEQRLIYAIKAITELEGLPQMLSFIDLNTLTERMSDKHAIDHEFLSRKYGWCKAHFLTVEQNGDSDGVNEIVFAIELIDDKKRHEERLVYLSETDAMTGLNNRGSGERKITALMDVGCVGMFCLLDADKFKSVNDNYGHDVGDKVIKAIADSLKHSLRNSDIMMRLGGDEFAFYALGVTDEERGWIVINRLFGEIDKIAIPELGDRKIKISLGAALYDEQMKCTFNEIYKRADIGVYTSKKTVGNSATFK